MPKTYEKELVVTELRAGTVWDERAGNVVKDCVLLSVHVDAATSEVYGNFAYHDTTIESDEPMIVMHTFKLTDMVLTDKTDEDVDWYNSILDAVYKTAEESE